MACMYGHRPSLPAMPAAHLPAGLPVPLLQVFLGGVSNDTNVDSLQAYCGQWGELSDVHVMEGKGYAFVTFAAVPTAQAFLEVGMLRAGRALCHAIMLLFQQYAAVATERAHAPATAAAS